MRLLELTRFVHTYSQITFSIESIRRQWVWMYISFSFVSSSFWQEYIRLDSNSCADTESFVMVKHVIKIYARITSSKWQWNDSGAFIREFLFSYNQIVRDCSLWMYLKMIRTRKTSIKNCLSPTKMALWTLNVIHSVAYKSSNQFKNCLRIEILHCKI